MSWSGEARICSKRTALPNGGPRAGQDYAAVVRRRWADLAVNYLAAQAVSGRISSKHLGGMYCVVHPSGKSPSCPGACASFVWSDRCIDSNSNSHWPQACLSIYDGFNDSKVLIDLLVSG